MVLTTEKVITERERGVGWITINNPERRNAVSLPMWEALAAGVAQCEADDAIRAIIMKGAGGKAFMSGADIGEFETSRANAEASAAYSRIAQSAGRAMMAMQKPFIAMINGFCIGGGLATALRADIRIASRQSQFGIPAARLGLSYAFDALQLLSQTVGRAVASEIMFTGRRFSAAEALQMGLLNHVVDEEELEPFVRNIAEKISSNAPLTIQAAKYTLSQIRLDAGSRDMLGVEARNRACMDSEDYKEGRRAFVEKRTPKFIGK